MSSTFGNVLHLSIFGQSHSPAIGCSLDGIPAGIAVDQEQLQAFLDRRAPGRDETATKRREADAARIIAGVVDGHTTGAPIAALIENTNTRSKDYSELRRKPRPGHADFPARVKYHNMHDVAGGGHFSGRLTAPLCIAGGIALQALEARGIKVMAHVAQIGGISDLPMDDMVYREADRKAILSNDLPCIDAAAAGRMREEVLAARDELDSIGGIVECVISGLPIGFGGIWFDALDACLASAMFGIPACKGVEFGDGFALARMRGSQSNDAYRMDGGRIVTKTNHMGGIVGGMSDGAPVVFRTVFKPTPSISVQQETINLKTCENDTVSVKGRHDPCIVPRAVAVVEAMSALTVLDQIERGFR